MGKVICFSERLVIDIVFAGIVGILGRSKNSVRVGNRRGFVGRKVSEICSVVGRGF